MVFWIGFDVIIVKLPKWGTVALDVMFIIETPEARHGLFYLQDDGGLLHHCIGQCIVIHSTERVYRGLVGSTNKSAIRQQICDTNIILFSHLPLESVRQQGNHQVDTQDRRQSQECTAEQISHDGVHRHHGIKLVFIH